ALTTEANFLNKPESVKGFDLLKDRMDFKDPVAETIVFHSDSLTVDDPEFQQVVESTSAAIRGLTDAVNTDPTKTFNYYEASQSPQGQDAAKQLVSTDRHSTIMPVTFIGELADADNHTDEYLNAIKGQGTDAVQVRTVGDLSI